MALTLDETPSNVNEENDENIEKDEIKDEVFESIPTKNKAPKLSRMRSPSFEGYFASQSGAIALQTGNSILKSTGDKIGEIQKHLEHMVSILREIDALRMAVRIESKIPLKKRYLTVVSSEKEHSAIIGIDWCQGKGPTIGLVLPIHASTVCKLDGDGGFQVSRTSTLNHIFRPVSVQTLWSARHVIEKAIQYASKHRYFDGIDTNGFLDYYRDMLNSDFQSITEWNELSDCDSHIMGKVNLPADPDPEKERIKTLIRVKLKEVMRHLNMDETSMKTVRDRCEKEMGISLTEYKMYISDQILVVMGQMDSASEILDYMYLGSEWNASDLDGLKQLGVGYVLNLTREVENFFPQNMVYYNIRVMDVESTELLKHWDHTYRFIERAREAGSKVLVHCRYGISRSASTVIAYLMKKRGWSMTFTLDYVVKRRDIVQPNPGFTNQLIIYEGILNSSRNRFNSLFGQLTSTDKQVLEDDNDELDGGEGDELSAIERRIAFCQSPGNTEIKDDIEVEAFDEKGHLQKSVDVSDESSIDVTENKDSLNESLVTHFNDSIGESIEHGMGLESSSTKIWETPGSHKKLRRAMTISSAGAVFIDNEDDNEAVSVQSSSNDTDRTPVKVLHDETEDAVMQQVVMATIRKNELMLSVKKLNDDAESEPHRGVCDEDNEQIENNIKPSLLRRLSRASQVLHFENIASMKKRRSRTDSDTQKESTLIECDPEMERDCDNVAPKSQTKVALLSEVFTRRSKKHIRDYARRRTLDDGAFGLNNNSSLDDVKLKFGVIDETVTTITEVPEQPTKLEWAAKTEKILPEQPKPQFPLYRLYGRLSDSSTVWKSLDESGEEVRSNAKTDAYFTSVDALNLEINELNRSMETITDGDGDESGDKGFAGGDKEFAANSDDDDDVSVADLVHLHDKMIREKSIKRTSAVRNMSDSAHDDNNETGVRVHRVQSFPRMKRLEIIKRKEDESETATSEQDASTVNDKVSDVKNIVVEMLKDDEANVKRRSCSLEAKPTTQSEESAAAVLKKRRASTDVDLRSVDQKD